MSDPKTVQAYNQNAKALADKFDTIGSRLENIKHAFSYIHKENPKVLEIGCGNGRDAEDFIKFTNNYLGIDASESMIELAKKRLPEVDFQVADMEIMDFPTNLDLIFAFASLIHADRESLQDILKRAHQALYPGGIFHISVKHKPYQIKMKDDGRKYYFYEKKDFDELIGDMFEIVYHEAKTIRGVDWLELILQKKS